MAYPVYHWEWNKHKFSKKVNIEHVYTRIASDKDLGLQTLGYTDINYGSSLHAHMGNFVIAVLYLEISGNEFWRVVTCTGNGTAEDCKTNLKVVLGNIKILENNYF